MENLNIQYIGLAVLGMLIHMLMNIANRSKKKNAPKLSIKKFLSDKMNWIRMGLSALSVVVLLVMADDLGNIFGITLADGAPATSLFAFGAGYLNHSMLRDVIRMFKKRVNSSETT